MRIQKDPKKVHKNRTNDVTKKDKRKCDKNATK